MLSPQASIILPLLQKSLFLKQIHQVHAQILSHGLLPLHNHLMSKLIDLHAINYARSVFDQMVAANDYSWNSMIRAYAIHGPFQESLSLYIQMLQQGTQPSKFTYPFVLKACSALSAVQLGEQVHVHVIKFGFDLDIFVNNSLIDMYGKCFSIETARVLFDEMLEKDQVSWNSIISGYVYNGDIASARESFEEMPVKRNVVCWTALIDGYGKQGMVVEMFRLFQRMIVAIDNVEPNSTLVCFLSACSDNSYLKLGRWVSVFIDVNRIPLDIMLCTALIGLYARSGDVDKARRTFDGIPNKTLATWNAMITGCVHGGLFEEAIQLFYIMRRNRVRPDEITMVNVLSACAGLGALELGREIHLSLGRSRLQLNEILATALVDMYSKCGSIKDACLIFVKSTEKDVILWNAMIVGLATHGHGRDSLAVFSQMERSRMQPNEVTFLGVLSACAHSGLVEEGRAKFDIMQARYNLKPKIEHYSCMVDLLGRAGYLKEAMNIVKSMNVEPDSIVWGSLLSACGIHQNVDLADEVGKVILSSESPNVGCCILLSNIYASSNRWKDVARVRRLMKNIGMKKPSGCSWIEVDGVVNSFLVDESAHPRCEDIYEMHEILVNQLMFEGYTHNPDFLLMDDDGT